MFSGELSKFGIWSSLSYVWAAYVEFLDIRLAQMENGI